MHERSLAKLSNLEDQMQQIQATMVRFSKQHDIQQTANLLWQCVDESLQNPEQQRTSPVGKVPGDLAADDEVCKLLDQ